MVESPRWSEFTQLQEWDLIVLDQFAGFGHLRFSEDFNEGARRMGCPEEQLTHLVVDNLLGGKVHGPGSNNFWAKHATELSQRHNMLQRAEAALYHRLVIRHDQRIVKDALKNEVLAKKSNKVIILLSHPDLATVMNDSKAELERELGIKLFLVILLPDHLKNHPQFPYYTHNADLIIAPDQGSKDIAIRELERWWNINNFFSHLVQPWKPVVVPRVEVVPHSVHPSLRGSISEAMYQDRLSQVDPHSKTPLKLFIPTGGSAPGQQTLLSVAVSLDHKFAPHVLVKKDSSTESFAQALMRAGVSLSQPEHSDQNYNIENIQAFNQTFARLNPAVVMPKPGELVNLTQLSTHQIGGSLIVLTDPVGDQEKQNLDWVRKHRNMPSSIDQHALEDVLLGGHQEELGRFREMAKEWRAISVPRKHFWDTEASHGIRTARFLEGALATGIFQSMLQYVPNEITPSWENRDDGDTQLWWMLNEALKCYI